MKLCITLAWRYLLGRRVRTLLTTLAVVFGVMIMFGMNGIVPAVRASFEEGVRVAAHEVDLVITAREKGVFAASQADLVRDTPGVALVTGVLEQRLHLPAAYQIATNDGRPIDVLVINGWEPDTSRAVVPFQVVAGRWLAPDDSTTAMVLESFVQRTGVQLGDMLRLPTADGSRTFEIVGVLPARPVFGDEEVYIPLAAAQQLFGMPGQINAIAGQVTPDSDADAVRQAVAARLGDGYTIGAVEAGGQEWEAVLGIAEVVFTTFGVLALAMGGFIMFNTFRTSVAERKHDLGMLRAVGASRRTVVGLVLTEGLLVGALGTLAGMLVGFLLVRALLPLISPTWQQFFGAPLGAPAFSSQIYLLTISLGLGIPLISSLLPALAASRVTPLEALRPSLAEAQGRVALRRAAWGAALIGLALAGLLTRQAGLVGLSTVLFLVGLALASSVLVHPAAVALGRLLASVSEEGHLAQRNLVRQPGRAAVTVSTIMISLAILVALAGLATTFTNGLMDYLEQSMRADYLLLPEALVLGQANEGAGPELAEQLRATPGIAAVTTLRQSSARINDVPVQMIGIDPATYPDLAGLVFSAGAPQQAYARLAEGRFIIVNGLLGAQQGITVGQEVLVQTDNEPQAYQVVGVGVDYLNSRVATAYVSHANLARDLDVINDVLLMANHSAAAQPLVVEAALLELTRAYPSFSLLSFEQWRESQLAANQTRTNIMYVLMAFLAVPSLLALANTLGINVLERTREIGMLRAIGSSRAQVRRLIIAESMLLSMIGVALGILAGLWLGYALVGVMSGAGFVFSYVFPTLGIALAVVVGLLFGVLAALLPAQHAASLNVVEALRY